MTDRLTRFSRGACTFDVFDEGPLDGEPVILLHGFPEDASSWDAVLPALHAAGLRTLVPNQRGYSPAARPSRVRDYGTAELVADVLALADAAGLERFHLVGHDWGGGVAWLVAGAAEDRVRTLTVLSTPHPRALLDAVRRLSGQAGRSWYMGYFQLPGLPESLVAPRLERTLLAAGLDADSARRYGVRFRRPGSLTGPLNWYRALAPWHGATQAPMLPVRVPTTYVWGSRDRALGRSAAEATGDHVEAPYRFIELDADHWLPENEPAEVADAVLAQVLPNRG